MLEKCCCVWDLYDGSVRVAIVTCIMAIVGTAWFLYRVISHEAVLFEPKTEVYVPYLSLVLCVLMIIASILLFIAIKKDIEFLVLLWLVIYAIAFLMGFVYYMGLMFKKDYLFGGLTVLLLVPFGYFWLIVYSFYEDQYGEQEV